MKNKLIEYDRKFVLNDFKGQIDSSNVFSYIEKGTRVCLSAPHSVKSFCNHKVKQSDLYTGALVCLIGEMFDFSYMVRDKFVDYKCRIDDFVLERGYERHYFLDIHGMKNNDDFDLAVGLGVASFDDYKKELEKIDELAKKYDVRYVVNHLNYMGKFGFTGKFQQKTGMCNIIQLEWSKSFRNFYDNFEIVSKKTIPFLVDLAKCINNIEK